MNDKLQICAYYSQGPHYVRMVKRLREEYTTAQIAAMVPPDYPVSEELLAHVDGVIKTELPHFSPRNVAACHRLLRQIRSARYDVFAVMFDSSQLCLLAALSRTPRCLHGTMDGRLVPLSTSICTTTAGIVFRGLWGRLVYIIVWLIVHLCPVRAPENK